jgi:hypothetical protein
MRVEDPPPKGFLSAKFEWFNEKKSPCLPFDKHVRQEVRLPAGFLHGYHDFCSRVSLTEELIDTHKNRKLRRDTFRGMPDFGR